MPFTLETPQELALAVAERVRAERLARGWSQVQLAERAGLSIDTYRVFERRGQISLERLLAIAIVLGRAAEWDAVFRPRTARSLDELDADRHQRKRAAPLRRQTSLPPNGDEPTPDVTPDETTG